MTPRTRLLIVGAIALLFIGAISTVLLCAVSYFQGTRLFDRAYTETLRKQYDDAITHYTQAIGKRLDSTRLALAYGNRGWCYAAKGQNDLAIHDYTESIRLDPRPVYSVLDRGLAYHRKGEFEKALADYTTAISKDPNVTDALYCRGLIFALQSDWSRAIADFTEAIRCQPDNAQFFVDRGMIYAVLDELDAAIANFDAALAIDRTHSGAYIQRAEAYNRKGDPAKGLADVTEAIRQTPDVEQLFYARACIYLERGAPEKALADCDEALRLAPKYDLGFLARAHAFAEMGDWDRTLRDADAALKITPKREWGHYLRGRALSRRGQFEEAISEFNQALAIEPGAIWSVIFRAETYTYIREYSRARDHLRQLVERFPRAAVPHFGLAWFLATCPNDAYRDGTKAIAEATRACDLSKWTEWYDLDALAAAYAEQGDFGEAILYANAALRLPNLAPYDRYLVEARLAGYNSRIAARDLPPSSIKNGPLEEAVKAYAQKRYDRAIARLNTILPPNPGASVTSRWFHFFDGTHGVEVFAPTALSERHDRANAFYYRALAYEAKKKWDNAIADFSTALSLEPDSAACWRERGWSYYQKRDFASALEDLEQAVRHNPDDALAYSHRADIYYETHQLDSALEAASTSVRIDPKLAEAYYVRGWIHNDRKEPGLALPDFEKAEQLGPKDARFPDGKGQTLTMLGSYKSAEVVLRAVTERFPESAVARDCWAWFLATCPDADLRNPTAALLEARSACELSDWNNASYIDTLAAAYANDGDFEQAVKYATRALDKLTASDPNRSRVMEHLVFFRRKEAWRTKLGEY